jgi:hypothetical protein
MQLKEKNINPFMSQDILIIADCMNGADKAALFATRNLIRQDSAMMLLQTYPKVAFGQSMLRNITSLLEKTARQELSGLKNQIVRNTGMNQKSISKIVIEGELLSVLKQRFVSKANIAVVLGFECDTPKTNTYCKRLIDSVLKSGMRPLYIVGNGITLISKDRITYFSGERNLFDSAYYQFLSRILTGLGIKESVVVTGPDILLQPARNQVDCLDFCGWKIKDEYPLVEKLFRSLNEGRDDIVIQTVKHS